MEAFADEHGYRPQEFYDNRTNMADLSRLNNSKQTSRVYFSEFFVDFVIRAGIPRKTAMRFIKDLKKYKPTFDVDRMNTTWSSLAKLQPALKKKMRQKIKPVKNQRGASNYLHMGLARNLGVMLPGLLKRTFGVKVDEQPERPHVSVSIATDGVELFRCGIKKHLWPVCFTALEIGHDHLGPQVKIPPNARSPMMATFFLGSSKPTDASVLLRDIVDELLVLDPRTSRDEKPAPTEVTREAWAARFTVTWKWGIGDCPARVLMKNVYGHSSTGFCEKCDAMMTTIVGSLRFYPPFVGKLRSWMDFDQNDYDESHIKTVSSQTRIPLVHSYVLINFPLQAVTVGKEVINIEFSPILDLAYFNPVDDMPLETMHTVYLLACHHIIVQLMTDMKRGTTGNDGKGHLIRPIEVFDARIKAVQHLTPSEFQRHIETTAFLCNWKATVYRELFNYYIVPLLEGLVDDTWMKLIRYFQGFLHLLGGADPNPVPERDINLAESLIEYFVDKFVRVTKGAGSKPAMHWLLHVPRDVRNCGCHFDAYSSFTYENYMGRLKDEVASGDFVMEQLLYRSLERAKYVINRDANDEPMMHPDGTMSIGWFDDAPDLFRKGPQMYVSLEKKHKEIKFKDFLVSTCFKDSFVLLDGEGDVKDVILRVTDIRYSNPPSNTLNVIGRVFSRVEDLYKTPYKSSRKQVYSFSAPYARLSVYPASKIVGKLVVVPRFSSLPDSVRLKAVSREEMLGKDYENVTVWCGTVERHILAEGCASLY